MAEKHYNSSSPIGRFGLPFHLPELDLTSSSALMTTKLYLPRVQPGYVARPRLLETLFLSTQHRLTLISAPTGFGKTSLLADWCHQASRQGLKIAWLSLENADNDPTRFWGYSFAALQTAVEGLGSGAANLINQIEPPPLEYILAELINEMTASATPLVFVLDDLQVIGNSAILNGINFLIEHLPENAHLIISTRKDTHLPLARMRAQKQLLELRGDDLRFTPTETRQYFSQSDHFNLVSESMEVLDKHIEGWAAGLQLVSLSLSKSQTPHQVLEQISLGLPFMFDYLVDEVLDQQPPEVRDFLVRCAVLTRLNASLCEALVDPQAGKVSAAEMLARLQKDNLFLISLDETHSWFRFHPVFGKVLLRYLNQKHPQWIPELHLAAARWYEKHHLAIDAVAHYIQASQTQQAARVLHESAWDYLSTTNQWATIKYWIDQLPPEEMRHYPRLYLQYAYALLSMGELAAAQHYLTLAEQHLQNSQDHPGLGELFTIRALLLRYESDASRIQVFARQALEYLPEDNHVQRSMAWSCLGIGYHLDGDIHESENALRNALHNAQIANSSLAQSITRFTLGHVCLSKGCLKEAERYLKDALGEPGILGEYPPTSTVFETFFLLGKVYYEWNQLERAIESLRVGIALSERVGSHRHASYGYIKLAHAYLSTGSLEDADGAIELAELTARELDTERSILQSMAYKAWLRLRQNRLKEASHWLNTYERRVNVGSFYDRQVESLVAARVYIALGEPARTITLLTPLIQLARSASREGHLFELLALQSLALYHTGKFELAQTALIESLEIAAPSQYIRVYLDEGEIMLQLLNQLPFQPEINAFVHQILQPAAQPQTARANLPLRSAIEPRVEMLHNRFFEPLTEREIEVLILVENLCSNQDIAERLFISPGTVKRHLHNIYTKLDVESRRQAVVRARSLGII
jgi:LuxR family maltose regulon positive regulatory protein